MDSMEMLDLVSRSAGLDAAYHVTTFKGYRPADGGGAALTTVEVWDRGPGAGALRFTVLVHDELGRSTMGGGSGNPRPGNDGRALERPGPRAEPIRAWA